MNGQLQILFGIEFPNRFFPKRTRFQSPDLFRPHLVKELLDTRTIITGRTKDNFGLGDGINKVFDHIPKDPKSQWWIQDIDAMHAFFKMRLQDIQGHFGRLHGWCLGKRVIGTINQETILVETSLGVVLCDANRLFQIPY
jgi:hypothetical protein